MKALFILIIIFISASVFSQNITNTLGTNGVFTIKDASNNYFTLSQSTGQVNILRTLRLENTTSSNIGILFKGADRFLHNFGTANIFLGISSGNFTMSGINNTAVGSSSLQNNFSGNQNTALGVNALLLNSAGSDNTALGVNSLYSNTDGTFNTAIGKQSLFSNTFGTQNIALGVNALYSNVLGYSNTAVGFEALFSNTGNAGTGYSNTAVGHQSLFSNTGYSNTAVGTSSLYSNTSGRWNCGLGFSSLYSNTFGNENTAVGYKSLYSNVDGTNNSGLGNWSLYSNITGGSNTGVGEHSLYSCTGSDNAAFGRAAGSNITTGNNLICLGFNSQPTTGSMTNQITLGDNRITSLRCNVQTITSLSDARDKKNITDLNLGLDFLMKVKPRLFNWDKREWYENNISDGSKMKETPTAGFIAQELDEVQTTENAEWLNLVLKDNPEKLEATYGNLLPVMVKAIQELKVESEELKVQSSKLKVDSEKLKEENDELKKNNKKLSSEVESLKSMNEKIVKLEKIVSELTVVKLASHNKTNEDKTISNKGE